MASPTQDARALQTQNDGLIIIFQAAGWGIYTGLVIFALFVLWFKRTRSTSRRLALTVVTVAMHAMSTVIAALVIRDALRSLADKSASGSHPVSFFPMFLMGLNYSTGDMIFIWRIYVLFDRKVFPCVLPILFLLGALGALIAAKELPNPTAFPFSLDPAAPLDYALAAYITLSLATTICSTVMIGIKTLVHQRHVDRHIGRRTASARLLIFMIESGFLYCLDWAVCVLLYYNRSPRYIVLLNLSSQFIGLFPTAFVVAATLILDRSPGTQSYVVSTFQVREGELSRPTVIDVGSDITLNAREDKVGSGFIPKTTEDQGCDRCSRCFALKSRANHHQASIPSPHHVESSCV